VITSVNTDVLDASFAGRPYDAQLLADLPPDVDPCGERHTFVWDGPVFRHPVACKRTRLARFGKDVFCDPRAARRSTGPLTSTKDPAQSGATTWAPPWGLQ